MISDELPTSFYRAPSCRHGREEAQLAPAWWDGGKVKAHHWNSFLFFWDTKKHVF